MTWVHFSHVAAWIGGWFVCTAVSLAAIGMLRAKRDPYEFEEEAYTPPPVAPKLTNGETEHQRHLREQYALRRNLIFQASRRERAEAIAAKDQVRK